MYDSYFFFGAVKMHMANELLSPQVAFGGFVISVAAIAHAGSKLREKVNTELIPLMGVLGAFVFAAQMINFTLPAIAGTSDHLIGTALLAILLGPYAAIITITGVLVIQCLIFQDGGLLALGVNIINMGIIPAYVSYGIWKLMTWRRKSTAGLIIPSAFVAAFLAVICGAIAVCLEVGLSGVLVIPVLKFSSVMIGLHALSGIIEGAITSAVLLFLYKFYPQLANVKTDLCDKKLDVKNSAVAIFVCAIVVGGIISLFASQWPDGLEKAIDAQTYSKSTQTEVILKPPAAIAQKAEEIQQKIALLPDYDKPLSVSDNSQHHQIQETSGLNIWTSISGITGTIITLIVIWLIGKFIVSRKSVSLN